MNDLNVAVIDDEEFFFNTIKLKLKKFTNIKVSLFKSPLTFSEELKKKDRVSFDLIIIDRFFPGIDVIQDSILKSIKEIGYTGKVILSSNSISFRENSVYPECDFSFPKETTIRRISNSISNIIEQKD